MKIYKKYLAILFLIIGICVITSSIIWLTQAFQGIKSAYSQNLPDGQSLNEKYKSLLKAEDTSDLKIERIKRTKTRNDIAFLILDSSKLLIYNLGMTGNRELVKSSFQHNDKSSKLSADIAYQAVDAGSFKFNFASRSKMKNESIDKLTFNLNADSVSELLINDSTRYYEGKLLNCSLISNNEEVNDIFIESKRPKVDVQIAFIIRDRQLYLFMLTPSRRNKNLVKKELLSIIN